MPRDKVFVSYSHTDKAFLDELLPALQAVPRIATKLWLDEQQIDIGDRFHPEIQQGLADSSIGILLPSNDFFTPEYIRQYELPYLVQQYEQNALRLVPLYVTTISSDAFRVTLQGDGQQRTFDFQAIQGANDPKEPLKTLNQGQRDAIYARLAERVAQRLDPLPAGPRRQTGPRFELAIALRARHDH
jgi:hypothetical protein